MVTSDFAFSETEEGTVTSFGGCAEEPSRIPTSLERPTHSGVDVLAILGIALVTAILGLSGFLVFRYLL